MSQIINNVKNVLSEKMIQLSIVAGVLFFIVANPLLFDFVRGLVEKILGVFKVKVTFDGNKLLLLHSVVFGLLFYVSQKFILKPVVDMVLKTLK